MTAQTPISLARVYLAEPTNTNSRWSDADMLTLEAPALRSVARDVEWPEGSVQFSTVPSVNEYTLPNLAKLLRVYIVSGNQPQIIQPTSIPVMQGNAIEMYDQSGGANGFEPQWLAQGAATYPVSNAAFGGGNSPIPYFPGQPPQYYMRGTARIGFVPAPVQAYNVIIDMIPMPASPAATTDLLYFPDDFAEAIAWKICEQAWVGDSQRSGNDSTWPGLAAQKYEQAVAKLRSWKENFNPTLPRRPQIFTYRSMFPVDSPTSFASVGSDS